MRSWTQLTSLLILALSNAAFTVHAANIVLTNDDGWAVAQIRAQFDSLVGAGQNVRLLYTTPAVQM